MWVEEKGFVPQGDWKLRVILHSLPWRSLRKEEDAMFPGELRVLGGWSPSDMKEPSFSRGLISKWDERCMYQYGVLPVAADLQIPLPILLLWELAQEGHQHLFLERIWYLIFHWGVVRVGFYYTLSMTLYIKILNTCGGTCYDGFGV